MGILCYIHSATNTYRSFRSYGWSTFASIGSAVRINVSNLVFRRVRVPGEVRVNDNDIGDSATQKTPDLMLPVENDSIPVNANNMGIEDSLKNLDLPLTLEDISNDVNAETNSPVKDKVGVWGYISSAIGAVKQKIVDFCKRSCKYGWFAVKKVDNAVRVDGVGKLKNYVQDNEALSYLAEVVIEIAKDALSVAIMKKVQRFPGGRRAYQIFLQSFHRHSSQLFYGSQLLRGSKEAVKLKKEIEELHGKIETLEKEGCGCPCNCRKLHDQTEFLKQDLDSTSNTSIH